MRREPVVNYSRILDAFGFLLTTSLLGLRFALTFQISHILFILLHCPIQSIFDIIIKLLGPFFPYNYFIKKRPLVQSIGSAQPNLLILGLPEQVSSFIRIVQELFIFGEIPEQGCSTIRANGLQLVPDHPDVGLTLINHHRISVYII